METTSIVVLVFSSILPILIVLDLDIDGILAGEGATNEGKTKVGKGLVISS
jgi:hypothetical protein